MLEHGSADIQSTLRPGSQYDATRHNVTQDVPLTTQE